MYENEYMYAIERDPEYLAHYGIKGMKWGVRKAIERGNQRALGRQYRKAQKKLAKLEKRAANGAKYARRAARLGAGAAAAGGLAALGTGGVSSAMAKIGAHGGNAMVRGGRGLTRAGSAVSNALYKAGVATGSKTLKKVGAHGGQAMIKAGKAMTNAGSGVSSGLYRGSQAVTRWGNSKSGIQTLAGRQLERAGRENIANASKLFKSGRLSRADYYSAMKAGTGTVKKAQGMRYSNNAVARVGAGAVAAGLAGAAGYNAYRAATTKRAAKKAAQFRSEMNKAFKGTQYANGGNRQGKKRRSRG